VSLWKGGFEASLNIQSKAGKASINLQVELEEALPVKKNSHSQLCRRERRAEARRLADKDAGKDEADEATVSAAASAEKAMAEEVTAVEAIGEIRNTAEKAEELNTPAVEVETVSKETVEKVHMPSIDDEFCSNDIYSQGNPTPTP
jgi:hypothetical protein